jgi:hypothetical protein
MVAEQIDLSRQLAARVAEAAMDVAMTEHTVAASFYRRAQTTPKRREKLLGLSHQARARAAVQWQLYARWQHVARTGEPPSAPRGGRLIGQERRRASRR